MSNNISNHINLNETVLRRIVILFGLMLIAFYGINGILPHQLAHMPLFEISLDNTFWAFFLSGIPSWIIEQPSLLLILEIALVLIGFTAFVWKSKSLNIVFLCLFIFLLFLQQTFSCTLTKTGVIYPIAFLAFCFSDKLFWEVWKLPRYYLVYMMFSAGLFKLINGGFIHHGQMQHILANQHIDLLFYESQHLSGKIKDILVEHRFICQMAYTSFILVELSFITLLFTRKFDKFFIGLLVLFCLGVYITLRINILEIFILILPLFPLYYKND